MKRRAFLKASALASTSVFVPSFLPAAFHGQIGGSRFGKMLVVIQLSGGNDGLNTVILAFSEFCRRVKQNASNGTGHGTANNVFLLGGRLKQPGFKQTIP